MYEGDYRNGLLIINNKKIRSDKEKVRILILFLKTQQINMKVISKTIKNMVLD